MLWNSTAPANFSKEQGMQLKKDSAEIQSVKKTKVGIHIPWY